MNIDAESDEGRQQSRRLHPGDNDDGGESGGDTERAVSRAADCTLLLLEIDAEFDEGRQQSRRLHPDDNEDGEGGGDKGPSAEPPTTP